jgi:hypothetical protein
MRASSAIRHSVAQTRLGRLNGRACLEGSYTPATLIGQQWATDRVDATLRHADT